MDKVFERLRENIEKDLREKLIQQEKELEQPDQQEGEGEYVNPTTGERGGPKGPEPTR